MAKRTWQKSIFTTLLSAVCLFTSCGVASNDGNKNSVVNHYHSLVKLSRREATCTKEGRVAYWYCEFPGCDKVYLDSKGTKEASLQDTVIAKIPHVPVKTEEVLPTCLTIGQEEYWTCTACNHTFADEGCAQQVELIDLVVAKNPHTLTHTAAIPAVGKENGVKEHWTCGECTYHFADAEGTKAIAAIDTIDYAPFNVPDFLVELPADKEPVVLQLTDTQIIDATQRPDREGVSHTYYATAQADPLCYTYLDEIITEVNPDLILLTGDNIYGEFDVNGSSWTRLVNFMDSYNIPWAPIFGNHDNESPMGVDWQCEQLAKAKNCLFDQKELSGNGNYSVGIAQGDKLTRVFYMLDSNGCGNASAATLANGHTVTSVGFKQDQIDWYTKQIKVLKEVSPETKISFAYHIQTAVFADAYAKYGFDQDAAFTNINIDTMANKAEGDFGYLGNQLKGAWDESRTIYRSLKALGVDSIFVGHEHENSASVVYEGIRFQFGQKSSQYDRYNYLEANGNIANIFGQEPAGTTPLMGGTVMVLGDDGAIDNAYIHYCGFDNGQINWSDYIA